MMKRRKVKKVTTGKQPVRSIISQLLASSTLNKTEERGAKNIIFYKAHNIAFGYKKEN
jgi:hypothetical protein